MPTKRPSTPTKTPTAPILANIAILIYAVFSEFQDFCVLFTGLEICQRTKSYKYHVCPMMKNLTNESGGSPGTNFGKSGQTL